MSQNVIQNNSNLAKAIKTRRIELGLTIEAAANKANVGTKTWCRYEAGEPIRNDKVKGICKALNWKSLVDKEQDDALSFSLDYYRNSKLWSTFLSENFGDASALSFIVGSDIMLDYIEDDMQQLTSLPKESHIGQIDFSFLEEMLPKQFLMEYDYCFLYNMKCTIKHFRLLASNNTPFVAHSVIEELALHLIVEAAGHLMDIWGNELQRNGLEDASYWDEWVYDILDDMDILTFLYSDLYLTNEHVYHFNNWSTPVFYTSEP